MFHLESQPTDICYASMIKMSKLKQINLNNILKNNHAYSFIICFSSKSA